jgi:hypothetical protein
MPANGNQEGLRIGLGLRLRKVARATLANSSDANYGMMQLKREL